MPQPTFNIFNILIVSGVVYGIIFSIVILSQKKHFKKNVKYLGLIVLFLSLSNFQYWLIDTGLIYNYPIVKYIYIPWHWLVLPMFYFYVQNFIGRKPISKQLTVYLISPFVIVQLIHVVLITYKLTINAHYEIPSHFSRGIFVYIEFASVVFNITLMLLVFKMIMNHESDTSFDVKWVKSETSWLKKLIYLGLLICGFWLCAIVIVVVYNLNKSYVFYPMWIGMSILIYWIGYVGLEKSKALEERIILRRQRIQSSTTTKTQGTNKKSTKITSKTSKLITSIDALFQSEKLYLNPSLNLNVLAETLQLSPGHVSKIINTHKNTSFKDYVNSFRLKEAQKMLEDKNFEKYTIVAIGLECGFNSKSAFYSAFKKHYNMTPSEYRSL